MCGSGMAIWNVCSSTHFIVRFTISMARRSSSCHGFLCYHTFCIFFITSFTVFVGTYVFSDLRFYSLQLVLIRNFSLFFIFFLILFVLPQNKVGAAVNYSRNFSQFDQLAFSLLYLTFFIVHICTFFLHVTLPNIQHDN